MAVTAIFNFSYCAFSDMTVALYIGFARLTSNLVRIGPTGRKCGPICTLYGANDMFCLVHVPFQGLEPSKSLLGVFGKKTKFRPILDLSDLQRKLLWYWSPREYTTLKRPDIPRKLDFLLQVPDQEVLSHTGGSTGS